jgi:hypothetical protein
MPTLRLTEWSWDSELHLRRSREIGPRLAGGVPAAYLAAHRVKRRLSRRLPVQVCLYRGHTV